ncbi:hypothetical protein ACKWMY_10285 [Serratia sp. J2]|uniref:hypothetical protein n=1 Tax=Serratia sp. J2 TaxID=3386551 RepID=UPI003916D096
MDKKTVRQWKKVKQHDAFYHGRSLRRKESIGAEASMEPLGFALYIHKRNDWQYFEIISL